MRTNPQSSLPPGFRFHPTDEELILHYLMKKVASTNFPISIITDVDIYKFDPWQLPDKAAIGEKEWYFFSPRDRKYPNGARPNRAAASGYWKATGTDKVIMASSSIGGGSGAQGNIGVKKALVFYKGKPPKGIKTNWIMHEYRLAESPNYTNNNRPIKSKESSMRLDDWVLCRIYKKSQPLSSTTTTSTTSHQDHEEEIEEQFIEETPLPTMTTPPIENALKSQNSCSFSNLLDAMDYSMLSSFLSENQTTQSIFEFDNSPPLVNYETLPPEPPFFNNYTNNTSGYFLEKLPQLSSSSPNMENALKRQRSNIDEDVLNPLKKMSNTCSLSNNSMNQSDNSQYSFLNQAFLNQQSMFHFQG